MPNCPKLENCLFFQDQLDSLPAVSQSAKIVFCRGAFSNCARFIVSEKKGQVPDDLFPADGKKLEQLLS